MSPVPSSLQVLHCLARPAGFRAAPAWLAARIPTPKRPFHALRTATSPLPLPRRSPVLCRSCLPRTSLRYHSVPSSNRPATSIDGPESPESSESRLDRDNVPAYQLTFTCKVCSTRSSHRVSKQGYHHGAVVISCPGCSNRHLVADHLGIFRDKPGTLEDILRDTGDLVKWTTVHPEAAVEYWDDDSSSPAETPAPHATATAEPPTPEPGATLAKPPAPEKAP